MVDKGRWSFFAFCTILSVTLTVNVVIFPKVLSVSLDMFFFLISSPTFQMGFVECLYKTGVIQPFLHTKKKKKMPVQVRKKIIVIHSFDEFFFILQFSITGDFIESVFKLK